MIVADKNAWTQRQASMRTAEMSTTKVAVTEALEKIALDDLLHVGGFKGGARRAVGFYLDRGTGGSLASLL